MVKQANSFEIYVSVKNQTLDVRQNEKSVMTTDVSTAANGAGETHGSECTPRGWHQVRAKIGDNCPANTIFVGRRPTGEIYTPELAKTFPDRDWILTRILWLSGLEPGFNRMGNVDTMRRFIYIHGCPDEDAMGHPGSHGCIKMRNQDVIKLYDLVPVGTQVLITE
jgi:L,D-transpeptidase YbiS